MSKVPTPTVFYIKEGDSVKGITKEEYKELLFKKSAPIREVIRINNHSVIRSLLTQLENYMRNNGSFIGISESNSEFKHVVDDWVDTQRKYAKEIITSRKYVSTTGPQQLALMLPHDDEMSMVQFDQCLSITVTVTTQDGTNGEKYDPTISLMLRMLDDKQQPYIVEVTNYIFL